MSLNKCLYGTVFAVLFLAAPALADDSEVLDAEGPNWRVQAPQSGTFRQDAQKTAPAGFQCPAGWSCAPKKPAAQEDVKCKSRFSRCYRQKHGGSGGGGDD